MLALFSTNTFTLPAGTYKFIFPFTNSSNASKSDWYLYNSTDASTVSSYSYDTFTLGGLSTALYGAPTAKITIAGSKAFTLRTTSAVSGGWSIQSGHWSTNWSLMIVKIS